MTEWTPHIVVFACNWCSYAGADTAGVSRMRHEPHYRMIRVMCSGRIQPGFVLRAFERGADGVIVSGCHFGDCHYVFGNHRAVEQFDKTMKIVTLLGIDPRRLRLEWISAAEGARFAALMNEFIAEVRSLGPGPFRRADGPGALVATAAAGAESAIGERNAAGAEPAVGERSAGDVQTAAAAQTAEVGGDG